MAGVLKIREANDGLEALKVCQSREINILFIDLMNHPVDGMAFIR